MKTRVTLAATLLIFLTATLPAAAADAEKGKEFFRGYCKSCHVREGEARELSPSSKTQSQWRRFFKRYKHKQKPEVWENLSKDNEKDLWRFLYENALDAGKPETCG